MALNQPAAGDENRQLRKDHEKEEMGTRERISGMLRYRANKSRCESM
jgi:hypothetical protein